MTIKEYLAAPKSPLTDADARIIGPELYRLAVEGHSSIEGILAEARKKRSPLHPYLDWDDTVAAEKWRRDQAGQLANQILIRVETAEGERTIRAFHAIRIEIEPGKPERLRHFLPIEIVAREPAYAGQVIEEALRQLHAWRDRWEAYSARFGPVFPAIDAVLQKDQQAA